MAASLIIEEEAGRSTGRIHPHNGYYAGDFSARQQCAVPTSSSCSSSSSSPVLLLDAAPRGDWSTEPW
jgi:hypothetical protein